uniref:Uncharacterized protein n=1 Tax=Chlorocebus sabaeus TaxID=60711 RepID=A0A0D9RRF3_CHLSB
VTPLSAVSRAVMLCGGGMISRFHVMPVKHRKNWTPRNHHKVISLPSLLGTFDSSTSTSQAAKKIVLNFMFCGFVSKIVDMEFATSPMRRTCFGKNGSHMEVT